MSDFTAVQLLNQLTPVIITGGYVPRGAYAAGTDYAVGDSVDYNGSSYVMFVDAAAGTLPTDTTKWQVLANKGDTGADSTVPGPSGVVDNTSGINFQEIATPANPSASYLKVYAKSDDKVYKLTSGGVESEIGAGGAQTPWTSDINAAGYKLIGNTTTTGDLTLQTTSGVGTTGADMHFLVGNNGATEAMTILNSGNVGIGTTAPASQLQIGSNAYLATGKALALVGSLDQVSTDTGTYSPTSYNAGMTRYAKINNAGGSGQYAGFVFQVSGDNTGKNAIGQIHVLQEASGSTASSLAFQVRNTAEAYLEAMRITSTGNVGIGTTSPGYKLDVAGAIRSGGDIYMSSGMLSGNSSELDLKNTYSSDGWTSLRSYQGIGLVANRSGTQANQLIRFKNYTTDIMTLLESGNVGIGTTAPTNILSLGGNSARIFWLERHTTSNTQGNTLTVTAGGATSGATDKAGGDLILTPGLSTGTGESGVQIKGVPAGSTGTTDGTQTLMIQVLGNKFGVFANTPVVKQTGIAALKVDYTAGDLDTEAEIITALNTTNTAINALRTALNNYGFTTVV